jgi:cation transporter-like permease
MKEYGPHSNVPSTILKESIKVLLLASIISSVGGLAVEHIKSIFVLIIPLIIALPALNDMIGDYGMILSARFSTMLYEGKIKKKWWQIPELKKLFIQISLIAIITGLIIATASMLVSSSNFHNSILIAAKLYFIIILDIILLVSALFLISVLAGLYFYKKQEDPNNFLIPLTTSIADFGNMIILSLLVIIFF